MRTSAGRVDFKWCFPNELLCLVGAFVFSRHYFLSQRLEELAELQVARCWNSISRPCISSADSVQTELGRCLARIASIRFRLFSRCRYSAVYFVLMLGFLLQHLNYSGYQTVQSLRPD